MIVDKRDLFFAIVGCVLGLLVGFFTGKGMYQTHESVKIIRDTMVVNDTIVHYLPPPKDSVRTKFVTRYLPVVSHDTTLQLVEYHDTVEVEVPIMSKHYNSPQYDIWISGYEANLDSAKVYQQTQYITETITKMKPPNRFSVGLQGGYGYGFKSKTWEPYVGLGIGIRIF